ncbi:bifunctional hydroxymethylpyrimidine kinase/phosphomethylpyrimidine kinase [Comamonas sp. UBA7528]|uniref:bifunctional hydroxymethylpyrimidine kinase/phosphomethylpyrimidine kinase n=1 Tax=Comamonas sp. UBA7528 TaxID=1946391 RepID=UPI001B77116E|nr:bifunctional hydroxymethylpyrimidine kinase/phosphomethylpyrimidine kinase [Comamonas sp. UBA7528]MBP7351900.1 bifunctional hydroxymethylpyrimidine kinase/phosphomethylpyrimidine kinase [Comamonas sp.]
MAISPPSPPPPESEADAELALTDPVCVLSFNACDPCGASGLTADITTIASVGGHPLAVVTGTYVRDTNRIFDHHRLDDEWVSEQARAVLEDLPVRAIKVGFVGSPEILTVIAEISTDYPDIPIISYMPDLSWWDSDQMEQYLDAFQELLLPQTSVLVGNHGTLWRWLLPDWEHSRPPTARDLAMAAQEKDVPFVLVTGIPLPGQFVDNVLSSPETVLGSSKYELFDGSFIGAGDTLSAALAALLATGNDLGAASEEALEYLDRCLDHGFRPGMGHFLPDRMFWAQPEDDEEADAIPPGGTATPATTAPLEGFVMPPHDTKH